MATARLTLHPVGEIQATEDYRLTTTYALGNRRPDPLRRRDWTHSVDMHNSEMKGLTWWCRAGSSESAGNAGASSVPDADVQAALDALLQNSFSPNIKNLSVTEHLDAKISAIAKAVTALNRASLARVMPLRRERNFQVSINRLPIEVLNEILGWVVDKEESYTPVVDLMKVCKQWHDFILSTPTFWNYISERYDSNVVSMLLERSKSNPLRLHCKDSGRSGFDTPDSDFIAGSDPIQRFLAEVRHHFSRWEDVKLDLSSMAELHLETPAPVLRNFHFNLRPSMGTEPEINLFDGHAPRLESLSISGWTLPWTSPVFNRLITLHISRVEVNPPSVGDLILILKASPILSDFQLSDTVVIAVDPGSLQSPIIATSLSHLHTWRTTEVDPNTMELLLEHFEMPAVSTVRLGLPIGAEWDNMPTAGSPIQSLVDSILHGTGDLGLEVGNAEFKLWKKAGRTLRLSVTRESAAMYLSWLVACYGSSLMDRITSFTCNSRAIDHDVVIRMLSSMENLEELQLESYRNLDAVLEHLQRPSFASSVGVWPLPRLRSFHLDTCRWSTHDALLVALQWRYGIALKNIPGLSVILPARLTSLHLNCDESSTELREIRTLVGYEHFSGDERRRVYMEAISDFDDG